MKPLSGYRAGETVSDVRFIGEILDSGSGPEKSLLLNECDIIYECRECKSLFRSVHKFFGHKQTECSPIAGHQVESIPKSKSSTSGDHQILNGVPACPSETSLNGSVVTEKDEAVVTEVEVQQENEEIEVVTKQTTTTITAKVIIDDNIQDVTNNNINQDHNNSTDVRLKEVDDLTTAKDRQQQEVDLPPANVCSPSPPPPTSSNAAAEDSFELTLAEEQQPSFPETSSSPIPSPKAQQDPVVMGAETSETSVVVENNGNEIETITVASASIAGVEDPPPENNNNDETSVGKGTGGFVFDPSMVIKETESSTAAVSEVKSGKEIEEKEDTSNSTNQTTSEKAMHTDGIPPAESSTSRDEQPFFLSLNQEYAAMAAECVRKTPISGGTKRRRILSPSQRMKDIMNQRWKEIVEVPHRRQENDSSVPAATTASNSSEKSLSSSTLAGEEVEEANQKLTAAQPKSKQQRVQKDQSTIRQSSATSTAGAETQLNKEESTTTNNAAASSISKSRPLTGGSSSSKDENDCEIVQMPKPSADVAETTTSSDGSKVDESSKASSSAADEVIGSKVDHGHGDEQSLSSEPPPSSSHSQKDDRSQTKSGSALESSSEIGIADGKSMRSTYRRKNDAVDLLAESTAASTSTSKGAKNIEKVTEDHLETNQNGQSTTSSSASDVIESISSPNKRLDSSQSNHDSNAPVNDDLEGDTPLQESTIVNYNNNDSPSDLSTNKSFGSGSAKTTNDSAVNSTSSALISTNGGPSISTTPISSSASLSTKKKRKAVEKGANSSSMSSSVIDLSSSLFDGLEICSVKSILSTISETDSVIAMSAVKSQGAAAANRNQNGRKRSKTPNSASAASTPVKPSEPAAKTVAVSPAASSDEPKPKRVSAPTATKVSEEPRSRRVSAAAAVSTKTAAEEPKPKRVTTLPARYADEINNPKKSPLRKSFTTIQASNGNDSVQGAAVSSVKVKLSEKSTKTPKRKQPTSKKKCSKAELQQQKQKQQQQHQQRPLTTAVSLNHQLNHGHASSAFVHQTPSASSVTAMNGSLEMGNGHHVRDLKQTPVLFTPEQMELVAQVLDTSDNTCKVCQFRYRSLAVARRHVMNHLNIVRFICSKCDARAFFCADLRFHLRSGFCSSLEPTSGNGGNNQPVREGQELLMTIPEADSLIRLVDDEKPGSVQHCIGIVVSQEFPAGRICTDDRVTPLPSMIRKRMLQEYREGKALMICYPRLPVNHRYLNS